MEVYSCTHGQRRDSISRLWSSVTVEAGVNFLEPWQGVAAGDFAVSGQEGESLLSESVVEQFYNFGQSTFAVNQVLYCIFRFL